MTPKIPRILIQCACGCGQYMDDRDKKNRPRKYIVGHISRTKIFRDAMARRRGGVSPCKGKPRKEKIKLTEEGRARRVLIMTEKWKNPEYKRKIQIKQSIIHKEMWADPIHRDNYLKGFKTGSEAHAWRGGASFIPYTKDFNERKKKYIRDRDGNICQLCGKTEIENGKKLTVHHIDYDKSHSYDDNLITLCVTCNNKVNYFRNFWTMFFHNLLNGKNVN